MHHCNIMYPSCDTIYTGVMLNVEIARTNLFFVCVLPTVPSLLLLLLLLLQMILVYLVILVNKFIIFCLYCAQIKIWRMCFDKITLVHGRRATYICFFYLKNKTYSKFYTSLSIRRLS